MLALVIILFGCSKAQYPVKQQQTPREILLAVKNHFQPIKSVAVKGEMDMRIDMNINGVKRHRTALTFLSYAIEKPRKFRIEEKSKYLHLHLVAISNGNTMWEYSSKGNKYTEKKLPKVRQNRKKSKKGLMKIKKKFAVAFNPLADSAKNISVLGRDTLRMPDSTEHIATKLSVNYQLKNSKWRQKMRKGSMVKGIKLSPATLWIDTSQHQVLKITVEGKPVYKEPFKKDHPFSFKIRTTLYFTSYDEHPDFADSMFTFHPPKGAKKVKQLHLKSL